MNVTFPKTIDKKGDLFEKLTKHRVAGQVWLSRIIYFEESGITEIDEKIAQLMPLIEEACKHTKAFCYIARKIYRWEMENNQPQELIALIATIREFTANFWKRGLISLEWTGIDLFPGNCLPFKFMETQEGLKETKTLIINNIYQIADRDIPLLAERFEKIINSIENEEMAENSKRELFFSLKLAKSLLAHNQRSAGNLFSVLYTIKKAFSLALPKNRAVVDYPLCGSLGRTLAFIDFPPIFRGYYKMALFKTLTGNFENFNMLEIDGGNRNKRVSPLFFSALLNALAKAGGGGKLNIFLTNIGLEDKDLAELIKASINLRFGTLDLRNNKFNKRQIEFAKSLIRCDRLIVS